ncbi:hypothetical protein EV191_10543 [Tamaricihabitans halophyticus]|uniref:Uncharacterized protein n=1 Tax=Tamaricihabitans halophyticus TaxID=1262583 RepID=A0A4R2QSV1_9PSEU|nr:hypothetical protein [Tamaricihabitans halophyticus]TCP52982.1 hypothetical protein EV191_10543 [Tamaricihabitans halophyticus]
MLTVIVCAGVVVGLGLLTLMAAAPALLEWNERNPVAEKQPARQRKAAAQQESAGRAEPTRLRASTQSC